MSKQDRQGVRTPADIERKYKLGLLNKVGGSGGGASSEQLSQLHQILSQYMATTNRVIADIQEQINAGGTTPSASIYANALKGAVNGIAVGVGDVSPIEHEVTLKVSSKDAKVTGYKGNIANIPDVTFTGYTYEMKNYLQWYVDLPLGAEFTISANGNISDAGAAKNWRTFLTDGSQVWLFNGLVTNGERKSVTATKTKHFELSEVTSSLLYCGTSSSTDFGQYYYKDFTINIGDKDLGYDAYEPQTYSPDADGNIKITSFHPNMSFVPDTDGVTLDLEYNRDINKAFAELIQAIISLGGTV